MPCQYLYTFGITPIRIGGACGLLGGCHVRVLIISQCFYPENFGINEIAYDLVDHGHTVTVLTGMPNYPAGRIAPGYGGLRVRREMVRGVSVIRVPIFPRGRASFFLLALNYLSFAIMGSLLAPFVVRQRIDVTLVYQLSPLTAGLPALVLRLFKQIPIVFWIQDIWPESLIAVKALNSGVAIEAVRRLAAFIYLRCRIILVQSPAFIAQLRALGLADADIRYLPNTAPDYFRPVLPPPDVPERKLLSDGFNVVFAGNIGSQQDPETILAAAELLRDVREIHWVIVGDGRLREWLASEIAKRNLSDTCRLLERRPAERMPILFGLADALLVILSPSCISGLTIPSKLQCYLACGRPIVGAIDGASRKIIEESGAGLVSPPGRPRALANAVLTLYKMDPVQRAAMGHAARAYFERHFDRSSLFHALSGCLTEASNSSPSTRSLLVHESIPTQ
jgi:colanic acid biosynthesis glycosyl transferase WcaI